MKKNIELVFIGDSLTARADWKKLMFKDNIVNLGVDGDTTLGMLRRVDKIIELEPSLVLIMAGVNDLCLSTSCVDEVFENYKKIVRKLTSKNIHVIVQSTLFTQMPTVNKKVLKLNNLLRNYSDEDKLDFLDLNPLLCQNGLLKENYTTDGLHLNSKAYTLWSNEIKEKPFYT